MVSKPMPVWVISLARDRARRAAIAAHLQARRISFEFIDAVDGRLLPQDELSAMLGPGVSLPAGHVGCYLSHLKAYRKLLESGVDAALILEDDARVSPQVAELVLENCHGPNFDYCFLDSENSNDKGPVFYDASSRVNLSSKVWAHLLSRGPRATHALIVSRLAAEQRLGHAFPIVQPIDVYDHLPYDIRFAAVVHPKLAWLGEEGLQSSTYDRPQAAPPGLQLLRRWPAFYRVRDIVCMRPIKWALDARRRVAAGELPPGRRWMRLPSGKEIVFGG